MNSTKVTLADVRRWPLTISVEEAAAALGVSRAVAYSSIASGTFPVRTVRVSRRLRVVTADLVMLLTEDSEQAAPAL